jgi:hypothetical protein
MSNSLFNWHQFSEPLSLFSGDRSMGNGASHYWTTAQGVLGMGLPAVAVAIALSWASPASADWQPPDTAPDELVQLLSEMDAAANARDLDGVMTFVSDDFVHADGLDADTLEDAIEAFWERFETLSYDTAVLGWERDGDRWAARTVTRIVGLDVIGDRSGRLEATVESRQTFEDGALIEQTILTEESQLTLGANAPVVDVNLAEKVGVGESFSFDAIVIEPLGESILMGTAYDEAVGVDGYLEPSVITLDLLSAGGLFKVGVAPANVGDRWISAVVVRNDGITALTRRLHVVAPGDL